MGHAGSRMRRVAPRRAWLHPQQRRPGAALGASPPPAAEGPSVPFGPGVVAAAGPLLLEHGVVAVRGCLPAAALDDLRTALAARRAEACARAQSLDERP